MSKLYEKIARNGELIEYEKIGFEKGEKKGKTMDVDAYVVLRSLEKQMADLSYHFDMRMLDVYEDFDLSAIKQAIADVRNVAGCLFLKIQETEASARKRGLK